MIPVTRLDGSVVVINADLIETIERHGDTIVTLVSGTRFVVREDIETMVSNVVQFRAGVLRLVEGEVDLADQFGNVIPLAPVSRRPVEEG
jgi:flagellar protein FlbD